MTPTGCSREVQSGKSRRGTETGGGGSIYRALASLAKFGETLPSSRRKVPWEGAPETHAKQGHQIQKRGPLGGARLPEGGRAEGPLQEEDVACSKRQEGPG